VRLEQVLEATADQAPPAPPSTADLSAPVRVAIDYGDDAERADGRAPHTAGAARRRPRDVAGAPQSRQLPRSRRAADHGVPLSGQVDGDAVQVALDLACREVDEPVQFVKGLHTLYAAGARVFVEVGPKVLHGFAEDVLASAYDAGAWGGS
jgi:hypothetical protein